MRLVLQFVALLLTCSIALANVRFDSRDSQSALLSMLKMAPQLNTTGNLMVGETLMDVLKPYFAGAQAKNECELIPNSIQGECILSFGGPGAETSITYFVDALSLQLNSDTVDVQRGD